MSVASTASGPASWFGAVVDQIVIGWHLPLEQPPPRQSCPHLPHDFGSLAGSASHPLLGLLSQSRCPASQTKLQTPSLHAVRANAAVGHTLPQLPQFCGSLFVSAVHATAPSKPAS